MGTYWIFWILALLAISIGCTAALDAVVRLPSRKQYLALFALFALGATLSTYPILPPDLAARGYTLPFWIAPLPWVILALALAYGCLSGTAVQIQLPGRLTLGLALFAYGLGMLFASPL